MVINRNTSQTAPGDLELVRALLNSWVIPNDTRVPTDRFSDYARQHKLSREDAKSLRPLRDDLRVLVENPKAADNRIAGWIERLSARPAVRTGRLGFRHDGGQAGHVLRIVLVAMIEGSWSRLKACPDCRWVFYDHTRNASKRWCLMTAGGSKGRSCGTIAKVRRFRERQRASQ